MESDINTNDKMGDPINFYNVLKTQLLKLSNDFIREIDLSFDYIDKKILEKTKTLIDSCYTNDIKFKEYYKTLYNILKDFKDKLYLPERVKTSELLFLNDMTILNIPFILFKDESKNTKKTLVNYLKEFYITSNFLRCIVELDDKVDNSVLFNEIQELINSLIIVPDMKEMIHIKEKRERTGENIQLPDFMKNLPQMGGMDGLLGTLNNFMQNKEIMEITSELTSEIQMNDIDPMSMMNSLLSGNMNDSKFSSLLTNVTEKISNKIQNGDIDKNLLERHANDFMSQLSSNSELMNFAKNLKK